MNVQQTTLFESAPSAKLPNSLTVEQVAHLFDTTTVWVQQLAEKGILPKNAHGSYPLDVIPAYVKYLRDRAKGRGAAEGDESIQQVRLAKEAAEREIAEMKADLLRMERDEKRRELIPTEQVEEALITVFVHLKAKMRAIPNALAAKVRKTATDAEARNVLKNSVNAALEELSQVRVSLNLTLDDEPFSPDDSPAEQQATAQPASNPARRTKGRAAKSTGQPCSTP